MREKKWNMLLDIGYDIVGSILHAAGVWFFIEPCHIALGGLSGIALMLKHLMGLPVGVVTMILNVPLLIASYLVLNRSMTLKTIRSVIWMNIIMDGVAALGIPQYEGDRLIAAAFGGIIMGAGIAAIFSRGSTTGGVDILAKLLQKWKPYMQTGNAIMIVNLFIVACSVVVFQEIETVLYGIIAIVCTSQTIDMLLYGANRGSLITVHSFKNREIAAEIMDNMHRGTTLYKSVGGYSGKDCETLTCAIDRKQFPTIKKIIEKYDPCAFIIVSPTKEVHGEGFLNAP